MHNLQNGWLRILHAAEDKYAGLALHHNRLQEALDDTTNHVRHASIHGDSALLARIRRVQGQFETDSRRHLSTIKSLESFINDNEIWLMQVETEGMPIAEVRGSWEARTAQFGELYAKVTASQTDIEELKPQYEQLATRVPSLGASVPDAPADDPSHGATGAAPVQNSPL